MFPKRLMGLRDGSFASIGLSRDCYGNAGQVRDVIKGAFVAAGLPAFAPHSFRKTLTVWADRYYPTREGFKAFSQNIAHDSVVTTVGSYLPVSRERQAELIRGR